MEHQTPLRLRAAGSTHAPDSLEPYLVRRYVCSGFRASELERAYVPIDLIIWPRTGGNFQEIDLAAVTASGLESFSHLRRSRGAGAGGMCRRRYS